MITGIYNLPTEVCDAVGAALQKYFQGNTAISEPYHVKNAYSILSKDSKIMIIDFDANIDETKCRIISTGYTFSAEEFKTISFDMMPILSTVKLIIFIGATEKDPDILSVSIREVPLA